MPASQLDPLQNPEDSVAWEYLKELEKESDPLVKQGWRYMSDMPLRLLM